MVKNELSKMNDWLVDHVTIPIKNYVNEAFLRLKNSRLGLHDCVKYA